MNRIFLIFLYFSFIIQLISINPCFHLNNTRADELEIEFELEDYHIESLIKNGEEFHRISAIEHGAKILEVSVPEIFSYTTLVCVPAGKEVVVEVIDEEDSMVENIQLFPAQPLKKEMDDKKIDFCFDESIYYSKNFIPESRINTGEIAVLRSERIVPITYFPFYYNTDDKLLKIVNRAKLRVTFVSQTTQNITPKVEKRSESFDPLLKDLVINYKNTREDQYQVPSYLFIVPASQEVKDILQVLIDWKKEKGFEVNTFSTSEIGSSLNEIKQAIQNAYDTWNNPPDFVCLVGDAGGSFSIPTDHLDGGYYGGEGDHFYSLLDGNDILADVFLGRLSFNSLFELQTIVSKIVNYEKNPYTSNSDWFQKALLVGDPTDSGPSTITTNIYIKEMMQESVPYFQYDEVYQAPWSPQISEALNEGVSYFHYRGFANMSGWFNDHTEDLVNGFMLPAVTHITCITGDFEGTNDCRSEAFLKAGTPSAPKGAIAAVGTATGNTHTCFNNIVSAGIFTGIFHDQIYNMGGALVRGKLALYENYPGNPANHVAQFSYWNNLMGDPGLDLWTNVPQNLHVTYPESIPIGTNSIEIRVSDDSGFPVDQVWLTLYHENVVVRAFTNEDGVAYLPIKEEVSELVKLTASKHNYIPYQDNINIELEEHFTNVSDVTIDDDQYGFSNGNSDEMISSWETIEMTLEFTNEGSSNVEDVDCVITCSDTEIIIQNNEFSINSLISGETIELTQPILLEINRTIHFGEIITFEVEFSNNLSQWTDLFQVSTSAPLLHIQDATYEDDSDNIVDPNETGTFYFSIENIGNSVSNDLIMQVSSSQMNVQLNQNDVNLPEIGINDIYENSNSPVVLIANAYLIPGTTIPLQIDFSNEHGLVQSTSFSLEVGNVSVTTPVGPDQFGYYCYDDGDVDFIDCPEYSWIEIDPAYGGNGTEIYFTDVGNMADIEYVDLPFPFTFYGIQYNQLSIGSDGWISPGITQQTSFMNWDIPNVMGPSPIIAPFWDDLLIGNGNVCIDYHEASHSFIVEWSHLQNEYDNSEETFQVILYDQTFYPTSNGNSPFKFQYQTISNVDQGSYGGAYVAHGQYATVGIENEDASDGLQYTYNNQYPITAKQLENEMALFFSAEPIHYIQPHIVISEITIVDESGNNQVENGESFQLILHLQNIGEEIATNVIGTISSDDEFLTIDADEISFGDISGGAISTNDDGINMTANINAEDGHQAFVLLEIESDQADWELWFNLNINAPQITLNKVTINDGNNMILDPTESAILELELVNIGGASASELTFLLQSEHDQIIIDNDEQFLEFLGSEENIVLNFPISATLDIEIGETFELMWQIQNNDSFFQSGVEELFVSQVPVNFEEDFDVFPPEGWQVVGNNWVANPSSEAGGLPPEVVFYWFPENSGLQRLISPPINTLGSTSLSLSFRNNLYSDFIEEFEVGLETSKDGVNWHKCWQSDDTSSGPSLVTLQLDQIDVGAETFQFAFYYEGNTPSIWAWFIDSIEINEIPIEDHAYISGIVALENRYNNVEHTLIQAGDIVTYPDSDGHFFISLPLGEYDVKASLAGYESITVDDVLIDSYWTDTEINFDLQEISIEDIPEDFGAVQIADYIKLMWQIPGNSGSSRNDFKSKKQDRDMIGYYLYRNGEFHAVINEIEQTYFIDQNIPNNVYEYYLTAVYEEGESLPTEIVAVDFELPPPLNLEANIAVNNAHVLLTWEYPEFDENITNYRIYKNEDYIGSVDNFFYVDAEVEPGEVLYQVTAMYGNHESNPAEVWITITSSSIVEIPLETKLLNNQPNPFNPSTSIRFDLAEESDVELTIFNIKGEKVIILLADKYPAGKHQSDWNGKDEKGKNVASGIYFYQLKTRKYKSMRKMLLLK